MLLSYDLYTLMSDEGFTETIQYECNDFLSVLVNVTIRTYFIRSIKEI